MTVTMRAMKADAKDGRLVLDEPTGCPRARSSNSSPWTRCSPPVGTTSTPRSASGSNASLREGTRRMKAGQTVDAATALAELRAHR